MFIQKFFIAARRVIYSKISTTHLVYFFSPSYRNGFGYCSNLFFSLEVIS